MIHFICTGHTNTRRQEQAPVQQLIKLPQGVGEAMSREGFPGICKKKKALLNKVVVFKQLIKGLILCNSVENSLQDFYNAEEKKLQFQ